MKDLRQFIAQLEQAGELQRIQAPVERDLEITEITDRISKSKDFNKALLFENVRGFDMPVLINAYGSPKRMAIALGVDHLDQIAERLTELITLKQPGSFMEKLSFLPKLAEVAKVFPKELKKAPCQEVVLTGDDVDLDRFPILKCWPQDAGRFVTLPLVFTKDPETGIPNIGMYRMQVYDKETTGMHWQIHKDGARHQRYAKGKIEVAVAIGGDPALTYAATAPLPPVVGEALFAGWLKNEPVEMVQAKTVDLKVPAHAEIILEGFVDPHEQREEGPFSDHTGFLCLADDYPVFHLTAITHRQKPIYHTTIVGPPPQEDAYLGKATERIFLPLLKMVLPEVVDMDLPVDGVFHNLVLVSIKKRYPGHARKVMSALWGLGQMMFAKVIVVVDADVDVHNYAQVAWKALGNIDPRRDLMFVDGPVDVLDHASPFVGYGSKVGIDATRKGPEEGITREWPPVIAMAPEIKDLVTHRWRDYFAEG